MKKVLISILSLIFIVSMITTVNAATASINLGASSDTVVKGKTFTVTVAGTADNNITGMEAKLSYDASKLSIESKSAGAGFSDLSGSNEIAIAATSSENLSKTGTLYTITFKVLDTVQEGNATISVTGTTLALVNGNSEQENVNIADQSVTVNIKAEDTVEDTGKNDDKTKEELKIEDTTKEDTTKTDTTKKDTTKKETNKLPQTGLESASIIAITVLGIVSIVSYVSYRKYKNI